MWAMKRTHEEMQSTDSIANNSLSLCSEKPCSFNNLPLELQISLFEQCLNHSPEDYNELYKQLKEKQFMEKERITFFNTFLLDCYLKKFKSLKLVSKHFYNMVMSNVECAKSLIQHMSLQLQKNEKYFVDHLSWPSLQKSEFKSWYNPIEKRCIFDNFVDAHQFEQAEKLINTININGKNWAGSTPLHQTLFCTDDIKTPEKTSLCIDFIKTLLTNGADPNISNDSGDNALHLSCLLHGFENENDNAKVVKLFLDSGVNPHITNQAGRTPLGEVVCDSIEKIKVLLAAGADINHQDNNGSTLLMNHFAWWMYDLDLNDFGITNYLLKKDANLNLKDKKGNIAFLYAFKNTHNFARIDFEEDQNNAQAKLSNLIILNLNYINYQNKKGKTALMLAAKHYPDVPEMAQILIEDGARTDLKDNKGRTALDIARECNNQEIVNYLLSLH